MSRSLVVIGSRAVLESADDGKVMRLEIFANREKAIESVRGALA